jgi:Raf kinase inhibitor-like YbhB/YbcL family protein
MNQSLRPESPYAFLPAVPPFVVSSSDMQDGKALSQEQVFDGLGHTGKNISPHLAWSGFPAGTKSFAVTCYDPDAPTGSGFWHWSLFDLPPTITELPAGAASGSLAGLPAGAIHARNDYGTSDFGGAAPPPGAPHRYFFAVHALDVETLGIDGTASPAFVGFNLTFHTLARAVMVPVYSA